MRRPIDISAVKFTSSGPAQPVVDYETKAAQLDESGAALFRVTLFAIASDGGSDILKVKVAGEPKGLGDFLDLKGILDRSLRRSHPWTQSGRRSQGRVVGLRRLEASL
jgi:hypothetical protein